jgi:hypothetical protein
MGEKVEGLQLKITTIHYTGLLFIVYRRQEAVGCGNSSAETEMNSIN